MGIFNLGGTEGGEGGPVYAYDVIYDNDASGLEATDGQAAFDELAEVRYIIQTPAWEQQFWTNLAHGEGAPSSSFAGNGSGGFYVDTLNEELYGPVFFDGGIPGWNWGSPIANFVYSNAAAPSEEDTGDWWVWYNAGQEFEYTLYRHKLGIEEDDIAEWDSANEVWLSRTPKVNSLDVWVDLTPTLGPNKGVTNAQYVLSDLSAYTARTYAGGWVDLIQETTTGSTYELNVGYANAFVLTVDQPVTISLTGDIAATLPDNITGRFSEVTLVIKQDNTGGHSINWAGNIWWQSNEHQATTGANHIGIWKFVSWDNGAKWFGHRWGNNFQD